MKTKKKAACCTAVYVSQRKAPNSFRGISLTCVLAKSLEKIVNQQLEAHFHKIGAYHEDQYGFRKGRSCADLLLATIDDWLIAKDHKMSTSIVFIDLLKAFDNVRHDKLLIKLQKLGVSDTVLKWIHNFLRNRMQKVVVRSRSSPFYCTKGVPQGSVLSPRLLNIYVSDLHSMANRGVTGHICGGCATDTERRIFGRIAQISWQNFAE